MNKLYILLIATFLPTISLGADVPSVACFKAAMADTSILAATKHFADSYTPLLKESLTAEKTALDLCARAVTADGPINCFKAAMSDNKIFPGTKYYSGSYTPLLAEYLKTEQAIATLCAQN